MNLWLSLCAIVFLAHSIFALDLIEDFVFRPPVDLRIRFDKVLDGGGMLVGGQYDYSPGRNESGALYTLDADFRETLCITFRSQKVPWVVTAEPAENGFVAIVPWTDNTAGESFAFIDQEGSLQGIVAFDGDSLHGWRTILESPDGGYLIGGTIPADSPGYRFAWLRKISAHGGEEWQSFYGDGFASEINCVFPIEGGYLLAGWRGGGDGETNAWACKVGYDGEVIWDRVYGGKGFSQFDSISSTLSGGFLFSGHYWPASGPQAAYLVKTNADGALVRDLLISPDEDSHMYFLYDALELPDGSVTAVGGAFVGGMARSIDGLVVLVSSQGDPEDVLIHGEEGDHYDVIFDLFESPEGELCVTGWSDGSSAGARTYWRGRLII